MVTDSTQTLEDRRKEISVAIEIHLRESLEEYVDKELRDYLDVLDSMREELEYIASTDDLTEEERIEKQIVSAVMSLVKRVSH